MNDESNPKALVVLYKDQAVAVLRPHFEGGFDCIRAEHHLLMSLGVVPNAVAVHSTVRTLVFQGTELPLPHLGVWIPTGSLTLQVWAENQLQLTAR